MHAPAALPENVARSLLRLKGLHQRLTICRVTLAAGCDGRLAEVDDPSLIAGLADDGALVVIFIHPPGIDDEAAACGLAMRLEQALHRYALPLRAVRVALMHFDAAAVDDADATRDELMAAPSRPLLSPASAAISA